MVINNKEVILLLYEESTPTTLKPPTTPTTAIKLGTETPSAPPELASRLLSWGLWSHFGLGGLGGLVVW